MIELLLQRGVEALVARDDGKTPLDIALELGAKVNDNGQTQTDRVRIVIIRLRDCGTTYATTLRSMPGRRARAASDGGERGRATTRQRQCVSLSFPCCRRWHNIFRSCVLWCCCGVCVQCGVVDDAKPQSVGLAQRIVALTAASYALYRTPLSLLFAFCIH